MKAGARRPHGPVFVGSTFEDLKKYRRAALDALVRLETIVRGMEYFGSKPGSPVDESLASVRSCQLYIGIFGMRYGSIPEGHSKSLTHLEYDEAQRYKLPSLVYIIDEKVHPIPPKYVERGLGATALRSFKIALRERHVTSTFTSPADLARQISHDVPEILKRARAKKKIPRSAASPIDPLHKILDMKDQETMPLGDQSSRQGQSFPFKDWTDQLEEQPINFKGMWRGSWTSKARRGKGPKSGAEIVEVHEQDNLNNIAGEFYDERQPSIKFSFRGVYKMSFLMIRYKAPAGQNVMEDGSCFLKLLPSGNFKGHYANFDACGVYRLRRLAIKPLAQ